MSVKGWSVVFKGERLQAELIAAILEADGLRVEVFGDNAYGVGIDLTEARLMVPDAEAERARRLIREAEDAPLPPDDSEPEEDG
jgi:putative signal transducing protein